jgi:hypothetical protein
MRRLTTFMIAATLLPVVGASAEAPTFSVDLPLNIDLALPGFGEKKLIRVARPLPVILALRGQASTCYYIRQLNKNLQKPKDKPEMVPLADESEQPASQSRQDCIPRPL